MTEVVLTELIPCLCVRQKAFASTCVGCRGPWHHKHASGITLCSHAGVLFYTVVQKDFYDLALR